MKTNLLFCLHVRSDWLNTHWGTKSFQQIWRDILSSYFFGIS